MARWRKSGNVVRVVTLADGVSSRLIQDTSILKRRRAAVAALTIIGVHDFAPYDFPDQRLETIPLLTLVDVVQKEIAKFLPQTVITHSRSDLNLDHQVVADAVLVACRPEPINSVRKLLHLEIPSATGWRFGESAFHPSFWVDVATTANLKLEALKCFGTEIREWPHARSMRAVDALMQWRGASVGMESAEAFEVSYWLQD